MSGAISENWVPLLLLLLIGVALIWWLGGRYARDAETPDSGSDNSANKRIADDRGLAATPLVPPPSAPEKPKAAPAKKTASAKKPAVKKADAKTAPKEKAAATKAAPKTKTATKSPAAKSASPKTAAPKKTKAAIPDNLELLKGVGPKLNTLLASLGITSFAQIAAWTASDIREIDAKLGNFAGRITRDNWVDQAKLLSNGDIEGFEKKYGSLGSEVKG